MNNQNTITGKLRKLHSANEAIIPKSQTVIKKSGNILALILFSFILIFIASVSIQAATYTVTKTADTADGTCDADCSLREAINASNATTDDDIIEFASPLFDSPQTITKTNGLFDLGDETNDTGTLTINGSGAEQLTIDGNNDTIVRIFRVFAQGIVTINDLSLTNNATGAVRNEGDLTINNVTIFENTEDMEGGGIRNATGTLTVNNSVIRNNSAMFGGGIHNDSGTVMINNSTISQNSVTNTGGGIRNTGTNAILSITNSTISHNFGNGGGGIHNSNTLNISNSTISHNLSIGNGGGIRNFGTTAMANITNSTISNNSADNNGGGIYHTNGTASIINSTISNNSAGIDGGGIRNGVGTLNSGNTIVANNNAPNGSDFNGTLTSQGYNLIEDTTGTTITGDVTGNITGQDPLLAPLGDYGGATNTHSLLPGSPAIDAGNRNGSDDQRGMALFDFAEITNATDGSDIGAFERQTGDLTCNYSLSASSTTISASGGNGTFDVAVDPGCPWMATSNDSWITVTNGVNGDGNGTVSFTVDENAGAARSGTITAAGETFTVNQDLGCSYSLATSTADHPASGETGGFTVNTSSTCEWTATTNDGWINIIQSSGTGENQVVYTVSANPGSARTGTITVGGQTFTVNQAGAAVPTETTVFDFDGDGKTDISIFRPSQNPAEYWLLRSSDGGNNAYQFGLPSDKPVPADFTGDGKTDIAFFRESTSEWFILRSEDSSFYSFPFGDAGDIPAPGDFDGDGTADVAVYRPSSGTWFINRSSDGNTDIIGFGIAEDKPVVADYDGDGVDDVAIYRPSNSQWWIDRSTDGIIVFQFGQAGDQTVPGDHTGDGKADVAFFRPSTSEWFVIRSEDQSFYSFPFGTNGDIPSSGDYDGDGTFDVAVFRPSNVTWYINGSTSGTVITSFGFGTDIPLANSFVVD